MFQPSEVLVHCRCALHPDVIVMVKHIGPNPFVCPFCPKCGSAMVPFIVATIPDPKNKLFAMPEVVCV